MNAPITVPILLTLGGPRADTYRELTDDAPIPDDGDVIVPLARALAAPELLARRGRTGVKLAPTDDALALAPLVPRLALVVIDFPTFADGRGYSHARRLRDHLAYTGEVRAVGDVGVDQLHQLARTGFTSFALGARHRLEDAERALARFTHFYRGPKAVPIAVVVGS